MSHPSHIKHPSIREALLEFGVVNCGIEIGLGRLEARPTATKCIDCKSLDEIREKQMAK